MKTLVTGGVRSGKSRHAEALIGPGPATYVAPGPSAEADADPDWAARLAAHRERRPTAWTTLETHDLASAVAAADGPLIVDCLGTWLTAVIDEDDGWDSSMPVLAARVDGHVDAFLAALATTVHDVVLVTNEVGLGVVPAHRSGRVFRDLLGAVNQRVATGCDEVHLVIAGRVLKL